jgi:GMP synthase (glutamine-hydrolysing)
MTTIAHRVLLLHCGPKPAAVDEQFGNFTGLIATTIAETGAPFAVAGHAVQLEHLVLYEDDALPESTAAFTAVIISGSKYDTTDAAENPWMGRAAAWLRANVDNANQASTVPILGICFGHQLLSWALGGQTGFNPRGTEYGTVVVRRTDAEGDALSQSLDDTFDVTALHAQTVLVPPPGAVSLFETDVEPNEMLKFAPLVYGTQFHPEYTPAFAKLIQTYQVTGPCVIPTTLEEFHAGLRPTPHSMSIVPRFLQLAVQHRVSAAAGPTE